MATMRNMVIKSDANGDFPTWAIRQSGYINSLVLAAGVERTTTVPDNAGKVLFNCTGNFYLSMDATAVVAVDNVLGTASELNPTIRIVSPGQVIHVISDVSCLMTLAYYR